MEIIDREQLEEMEGFVRERTVRGLRRTAYKAGAALVHLSNVGWEAAISGDKTILDEVVRRIKIIEGSGAGKSLLERYG